MKNIIKSTLNIFIFILFITNIVAQKIVFEAPKLINNVSIAKPGYLASGDIDGDGIKDIVVSSAGNSSIIWYKNKNGNFSDKKIITDEFYRIRDIKLVDVDGDNDLDVIAANGRANLVAWIENTDGKGNFSDLKIISESIYGASSLSVGDIDNDNDIDFVITYWDNSKTIAYINTDGLGDFSETIMIEDKFGAYGALITDVDNDGRKDVVLALSNEKKIAWYKNIDGKSFRALQTIDSNLEDPRFLNEGDIDNDGDNDLFCFGLNNIYWYEKVNGVYGSKKLILENTSFSNSINIADLDGDNFKDIIVGTGEKGEVYWFKNIGGTGNFSDKKLIIDDLPGAYAVGVADLDQNNTIDIYAASVYKSSIVWIKNTDGLANFSAPIFIDDSQLKFPKDMVAADFDSDGDIDVVVGNRYKDNLVLYDNKNGSFDYKAIDSYEGRNQLLAKSDIDNDGDIDIICAVNDWSDSNLRVYVNNGQGIFQLNPYIIEQGFEVDQIEVKDIDGDGKDDIFVINRYKNITQWYKNKGNITFSSEIPINGAFDSPSSFSIQDIDADGDGDLLVASYNNNTIKFCINANGNFSNPISIQNVKKSPRSVTAADMDGDGDMDIVYGSGSNNSIYYHKNNNGNFEDPIKIIYANWSNGLSLQPIDIDKDGDLDLIISGDLKNYPAFWAENKNGDFIKHKVLYKKNKKIIKILAEDINSDGNMDILSLDSDGNRVFYSQSIKAPVFTKQPVSKKTCEGEIISFSIDYDFADSIKWMFKKSYQSNFTDLIGDTTYTGAKTKTLSFKTKAYKHDNNAFTCKIYYRDNEIFSDTAHLDVDKFYKADAGTDRTTCYQNINLYANKPNGGSASWSTVKGSANIVSPTENSTQVDNLSHGENIFRWTVSNGLCKDSDDITIVKNDSIVITKEPLDAEVYTENGAIIEAKYTGDIISVQWFKNGSKLSDSDSYEGTTTSKLIIKNVKESDAGTYRCYFYGVCNSLSSKSVKLSVLTKTNETDSEFTNVFPNPVKDFLYIENIKAIDDISLLSIEGKHTLSLKNKIGKNKIDLTGFKTGVYILKIKSKTRYYIFKVVKI